MEKLISRMDCYVLAGGKSNPSEDFQPDGELTRLEKGYRRYAAIFDRVKLVLKKDQAREKYLNYPYILDDDSNQSAVIGVRAALKQSNSEAVFIGSSDISSFPLELVVDLIRQYQGESFLGYCDSSSSEKSQPLFGIFHQSLTEHLDKAGDTISELSELLDREGKLLPLPDHISIDQLGFG